LWRELVERGAELIVADLDRKRVQYVCDRYQAEPADVETVLQKDVDIIAPCALGGVLTHELVSKLKARAVIGGANNQLASPNVGRKLFERGIIYAPDYVVNAGGNIMVAAEYFERNDESLVNADIDKIFDRMLEVLVLSKERRQPHSLIANEMAKSIILRAERRRRG